MIDLSIINGLCEKKGITKKKMCDDLGFAPSKITDMLKNNSTTLVNLEKIANYFDVSVGLFFGEVADYGDKDLLRKTMSIDDDKIHKDYEFIMDIPKFKKDTEWDFTYRLLSNILEKTKEYPTIKYLSSLFCIYEFSSDNFKYLDLFYELCNNKIINNETLFVVNLVVAYLHNDDGFIKRYFCDTPNYYDKSLLSFFKLETLAPGQWENYCNDKEEFRQNYYDLIGYLLSTWTDLKDIANFFMSIFKAYVSLYKGLLKYVPIYGVSEGCKKASKDFETQLINDNSITDKTYIEKFIEDLTTNQSTIVKRKYPKNENIIDYKMVYRKK